MGWRQYTVPPALIILIVLSSVYSPGSSPNELTDADDLPRAAHLEDDARAASAAALPYDARAGAASASEAAGGSDAADGRALPRVAAHAAEGRDLHGDMPPAAAGPLSGQRTVRERADAEREGAAEGTATDRVASVADPVPDLRAPASAAAGASGGDTSHQRADAAEPHGADGAPGAAEDGPGRGAPPAGGGAAKGDARDVACVRERVLYYASTDMWLSLREPLEGLAHVLAALNGSAVYTFVSVVGGLSGLSMLSLLPAVGRILFFDRAPSAIPYARLVFELVTLCPTPREFMTRYYCRPFPAAVNETTQFDVLRQPADRALFEQTLALLQPGSGCMYARHVWPMVSKPWPWRTHPVVLPFYDTASEKKDWLGYRLSYNFAQTWYFGKAWLSEAGHVWPMVSKPWPWRTHPVVLPFYDTASEKKDWLGYRLSYNFAQTWYFGKAWLSEAGYARVREHMRQRPPRVFRRDLATGPPLTAHFRHGGLNVMFLTNILSKSFIANPAALFESWKKYSARGSQLVVVGTNRCEMFSGGRQSRCKEFAG